VAHDVTHVATGDAALQAALAGGFDAVILDRMLQVSLGSACCASSVLGRNACPSSC
jgi:DNA-binding response OmpR family regulator